MEEKAQTNLATAVTELLLSATTLDHLLKKQNKTQKPDIKHHTL